ncbi:MAG: hypothetical protein RLZZ436_91 [Planctomycetota bacterium]|jgi:hypothetical protein
MAKFSLFSFQDIITCLMGIMLLLTLLIAMQITDQPSRSADQAADRQHQLQTIVSDLQRDIAQLEQQTQANRQLLSSGALADKDLLTARHQQAVAAEQAAAAELQRLRSESSTAARSLDTVSTAAARQQADSEQEQQRLIAELAAMKSRLQQLSDGTRVVYSQHSGTAETCWIVEVTDDRSIQAAPLGRSQKPLALGGIPETLRWIRTEHGRGAEFLILLKPAAVEAADLLPGTLREEQIPHGYDLLGQDQTALDPERGAVGL